MNATTSYVASNALESIAKWPQVDLDWHIVRYEAEPSSMKKMDTLSRLRSAVALKQAQLPSGETNTALSVRRNRVPNVQYPRVSNRPANSLA
jgi:hypothetical protein